VPIVVVTKLGERYFAIPCTEELLKNCQQLFPYRGIMFTIAQVYTGMMKTCPGLTLQGPVGMAILQFLDWEIDHAVDDTDADSAKLAKRLQTHVLVRIDGGQIEHVQRYDLPLRLGTLVTLREECNFWLIEVSWGDFTTPGVRLGGITDLLACFNL
jgi:hypothetical protein